MGLFSSRSELISRPICYRTIRSLSPSKRDRRRKNTHTRVHIANEIERERGGGARWYPQRKRMDAQGWKDADRGCTLTHRHKINTFFSLHRRPGDNHEIMWPARASERHRNVWLPLRSVITHPRRAKPPPSVATCCVSLHRRQLSGRSTLTISLQVYRIDRREVVTDYADSSRSDKRMPLSTWSTVRGCQGCDSCSVGKRIRGLNRALKI